jgi:L-asparaginase
LKSHKIIATEKHHIHLITTGGTIDKTYNEEKSIFINQESITLKEIKKRLRLPYTTLHTQQILTKDSLDLTDEDRELILNTIINILKHKKTEPIIILHGTDTLEKTAKFCSAKIPSPSTPIIFTGAITPFHLEQSDAMQNIIESLTAAKLLDNGIYMVFHGEIFLANWATKNTQRGTFEHITY